MTNGIASVQSRVAAIEQRIAQLRGESPPVGAATKTPAFGTLLDGHLSGIDAREVSLPATKGDFALQPLDGRREIALPANKFGLQPAQQLRPGSYGPLSPPNELVGYGNGQIPAHALAPVGATGHTLWAPAAEGLNSLIRDAAADGVVVGITDTYRPIADQHRLAGELGLYSEGGLAAVPGTSNHGWGVATDLDLDASALAWMRENAANYGFVEDVPREPWHWTYRPANA